MYIYACDALRVTTIDRIIRRVYIHICIHIRMSHDRGHASYKAIARSEIFRYRKSMYDRNNVLINLNLFSHLSIKSRNN